MNKKTFALLFILISGLVGCDHTTKRIARDRLNDQGSVPLVNGVLDLNYTENRDVGFSALRTLPQSLRRPLVFALPSLAMLLMLGIWYMRRRKHPLEHLGFALILAGALGNLIDRLLLGFVIDFIHIHHWPIFNVADVCISVGIPLLLIQLLRDRPPALAES